MKNLEFYDVTLRDGSHANKHQFSKQFCSDYIEVAHKAGIKYIELGHGNGLGGDSLHIGRSKENTYDVLENCNSKYSNIKFGVHIIPGLATFEDMQKAKNKGLSIFRIASHCSESDTTETYMDKAINLGAEVWGLLMMSHMIPPDQLAKEAEKMQSFGAERIVFLDSAGALTPKMVKNICEEILSKIKIPLGFHAHNNLHAAVANSIAAIDNGCSSLDVCSRGYGAGAGNLSLEAILSILKKDGFQTDLDFQRIIELALFIERSFPDSLPIIDAISTASGHYGLFSGFKKRIIEASKEFNINPIKLIEELGNQNIIAGQEDQIIISASELKKGENQ